MRVVAMSCISIILACPVAVLGAPGSSSESPIEVGQGVVEFVAVATVPGRVYAASRRAVYESPDGGKSWEERFRPPQRSELRSLAVRGSEPATVLAATSWGLFGSFDSGATWSKLFSAPGEGASDCTVVAFHPHYPDKALLGTRRGLSLSADGGHTWQAASVPAGARDIVHAAFHPLEPARLYLVTVDGLWVGELASGSWQKWRSLIHAEETEVEPPASVDAPETGEEDGALHHLSAVAIDAERPEGVYLATSRGIEASEDGGRTWRQLSRAGLESAVATRLALQHHSPLAVYAATARGVARYEPSAERWIPLSQGRAATKTHDLAAAEGLIWAATDQGLYRFEVPPEALEAGEPPTPHELLANFSYEPGIAQVRDVAIRYAEVHPDKIRRWRRRAAFQALLPGVSAGYDFGRSNDTSIDEGSFPNFQLIKSSDRDDGFDVSVDWELGNLIWNDDQTSIDVRSKLMVELRDDIVNEVTRTYFERRRIQVALLTDPPKSDKMLLDKELRVQELTALLDGLTGGYFSSQVRVDGSHKEEGR